MYEYIYKKIYIMCIPVGEVKSNPAKSNLAEILKIRCLYYWLNQISNSFFQF